MLLFQCSRQPDMHASVSLLAELLRKTHMFQVDCASLMRAQSWIIHYRATMPHKSVDIPTLNGVTLKGDLYAATGYGAAVILTPGVRILRSLLTTLNRINR